MQIKLLRTDWYIGHVPPEMYTSDLIAIEKSLKRKNRRNAVINKLVIVPLNKILSIKS